MLHIMNIIDVICCILASLNSMFEFFEDGTDMTKHAGAVKDYTYVLSIVHLFGFVDKYFKAFVYSHG